MESGVVEACVCLMDGRFWGWAGRWEKESCDGVMHRTQPT